MPARRKKTQKDPSERRLTKVENDLAAALKDARDSRSAARSAKFKLKRLWSGAWTKCGD